MNIKKETKRNIREKASKADTSVKQEFQQILSQRVRPTKEQMLKRLCRIPKQRWEPPSGEQAGLSYTLSIDIDSRRKTELASVTGFCSLLDLSKTKTQLSVVHTQGYRRIATLDAGMFGQDSAFITNSRGALLFLDFKNKAYLQMEPDQVPPIKVERDLDGSLEILDEEPWQGYKTRKTIITIRSPFRLRTVLWLATTKELQPFAADVTNMIFGCLKNCKVAAQLLDEITKIGVPLRGESFLVAQNETFSTTPISSFALQDIKIRKLSPNEFAVPKGYLNLRIPDEVKKRTEPKRFRALGPTRLSEIRPGKQGLRARAEGLVGSASETLTFSPPSSCIATVGDIEIPECLNSTYESLMSVEIEQLFMEGLKFVVNSISRRLTKPFFGRDGILKIDWLKQFGEYSASLPNGDPLFCLLRDEPNPGALDPEEAAGGKGLIDNLAEHQAQRALVEGTILTDLSLSDTLLAQISGILNSPSVKPEDRWGLLGHSHQIVVREAWLIQRLGTFSFDYPDSLGPWTIALGLLEVSLKDIEFDVRLTEKLVDTLVVGDNKIDIFLKLREATGEAILERWPSTLYWFLLVEGAIMCFFVPATCATVALVAAVAAFLLLDIASVYVNLQNITIKAPISFVENNEHYLEPKVKVSIDASVDVFYQSYIPEPAHQIISAITSKVVEQTDIIIDQLGQQLKSALNDLLKKEMTLPPPLDPATVIPIGGKASGQDENLLYLESTLSGVGETVFPYITQTALHLQPFMEKLRKEFREGVENVNSEWKGALHYGGFAISQNLLNCLVYGLWRRGDFNYELGSGDAQVIFEALREVCPACSFPEPHWIRAWPAVSPRIVLTPFGYLKKEGYATAFFDDVRLCVISSDGKYDGGTAELQFAAQTGCHIGFGGVKEGMLDLTKVIGRFVDVYFDLDEIGVHLIHPEVRSAVGEGPGLGPIQVEMIDPLDDVLTGITREMLASKSAHVVPRPGTDEYRLQKYPIAGSEIMVLLFPHRGILYGQFGLSGPMRFLLPYDKFGNVLLDINDPDLEVPIGGRVFSGCSLGELMRE